jgi:hypothetical protein
MSRMTIAASLLLAWAATVQGARDIEFNVDFFCGWGDYYRPMEWTPVEVGIAANLKEPFAGTFTITARQDGLNTLDVMHSFVLTPDRPLSAPLVTKFAFATDKCSLAIHDEKGRTRWRQSINLWDFSVQNRLLKAVQEQDLLIGLIGQAQFGLLRVPESTACASGQSQGKVYLGSKVPRLAPWDWTGYASLDVLILSDVDWTLLRPEQIQAICEWISNGGTAVLILGQHPLPTDSPLARLLPFRIDGPTEVEIPAQGPLPWGLEASRGQTVTGWTLSPRSGAALDRDTGILDTTSLYGTGYAGFGRVAVLGFSPTQFGEAQAGRSARFWTWLIEAAGRPQGSAGGAGGGRRIVLMEQPPQAGGKGGSPYANDNYYRIGVAQDATNRVMEYLYRLEQMRPLSIWWIVLILMTLAVLLGPVDYFVLKRLDRLPYTWLTSTAWIVIFTVGAYFGVQWLRGGAMAVRAVTILDGIADSNCAWATSYTGLFAPRSGDYRLAGLAPNQWWSGAAPMRQDLWSYQHDSGMQQIHCVQADGGNLPVSLPINMWTVQPLLAEWALDRLPFAASVVLPPAVGTGSPPDGGGAARGEVTVEIQNTSDSVIQRGYVLLADACADLGPVPPHSTRRFEVRTRPFRPWQQGPPRPAPVVRGRRVSVTQEEVPRYPGPLGEAVDSAVLAQGCLNRTLALHTYLDLGATLVCVVFENAPLPVEVKDRSYEVNHVQMARLLVLPKK